MTQKITGTMDPDFLAIDAALRRAAKRALREGLETGTPVWVIKNGRMVDLTRGKLSRSRKPRGRK